MPSKRHDWYHRCLLTADEWVTRAKRVLQPRQHSNACWRPLQLGDLEPRILFSAVPIDPSLMLGDENAGSEQTLVVELANDDLTSSSSSTSTNSITQPSINNLVFIDSTVPDIDQLLDDLRTSGRDLEVFVLDADRDGVDQITEILESRVAVSSVHLVSHSEDGAVKLGNVWLGESNLGGYAGQLAAWQGSFTSDADILFYGCNLAANPSGQTFLDSIRVLTGADVAASTDDTGHASYGGDWDLEYSTGQIESEVAFSLAAQQNWLGKLATITVDTFDDENNVNATTSLREAIIQANAGSGGDVIVLAEGTYSLSIAGTGEDNAATGDLDIRQDVTIRGVSAGATIVDGAGIDRVFEVEDAHLVVSDLTIQGGDVSGDGGGIRIKNSASSATADHVIVTNNVASQGAGIFNEGFLDLTDGVLSGNSGNNEGGGLYNQGDSTLNRVTINGNSANKGGGIHDDNGANSLRLTNVTVSGNTANSTGGGLHSHSSVVIIQSTFTLNTAAQAGGIHVHGGTLEISSTIVADNSSTSTNADVKGTFASLGFNLIGDVGSATGLTESDITGVSAGLQPLADASGFGHTHALLTTSVAINAGANENVPSIDQTGAARNSIPDIGAMESEIETTKIYWVDSGTGTIHRSNVDGSSVQQIVSGLANAIGLEVDAEGGKIYWIDSNSLHRANLDGSDMEALDTANLVSPGGIALDLINGFVYVSDSGGGADNAIRRFNLDGTGFQTVVDSIVGDVVADVVVDGAAGKLYFSTSGAVLFDGRIVEFDLGTSTQSDLVTGQAGPRSLAIDLVGERIYWADDGSFGVDAIKRANLVDGSGVETISSAGLAMPFGIDVDVANGKVYWSDSASSLLRRSDLDGSNVEEVGTGINTPQELAVVSISVANTSPTLDNPIADQSAVESTPFSFVFNANTFDDADGDTLTYTAMLSGGSSLPSWLDFDGSIRTLSGTPGSGDVGSIAVRITADDNQGGTVIEDFQLTVSTSVTANGAPTISGTTGGQTVGDNATIAPFAAVTIGDAEGDTVTVVVTLSGGNSGGRFTAASLATSGFNHIGSGKYGLAAGTTAAAQTAIRTLVFDPRENQVPVGASVTTTMTITVNDGSTTSDNATTVIATSINDAPTLNDYQNRVVAGTTVNAPAALFQSLSHDVDGDTLTAVLVSDVSHGQLVLQSDGSFTYTPDSKFVGIDEFEWLANDGSLDSQPARVVIQVTRPPLTVPDTGAGPGTETGPDTGGEPDDPADETSDDDTSDTQDDSDVIISDGSPTGGDTGQPSGTATPTLTTPLVLGASDSGTDSATKLASLVSREGNSSSTETSRASSDRSAQPVSEQDVLAQEILLAAYGNDHQSLSSPGAMWSELDQQFEEIESLIHGDLVVVGATGAAASSFTIAVIVWAFRAGFLASGLLAQMPAWSAVDPLMIMQGAGGDGGESLEELMDRRSQALDEHAEPQRTNR